jgi:hypothetical protein
MRKKHETVREYGSRLEGIAYEADILLQAKIETFLGGMQDDNARMYLSLLQDTDHNRFSSIDDCLVALDTRHYNIDKPLNESTTRAPSSSPASVTPGHWRSERPEGNLTAIKAQIADIMGHINSTQGTTNYGPNSRGQSGLNFWNQSGKE